MEYKGKIDLSNIENLDKKSPNTEKLIKPNYSKLNREKQYLAKWRTFQQSVIGNVPTYWQLINFYKDLSDNPTVFSKVEVRKNSITSRDRMYKKNDQEVDESVSDKIEGFIEQFIKVCVDSKMFGYTTIKVTDIIDSSFFIEEIRREFINPKTNQLLSTYNAHEGVSLDSPKLKNWMLKICDETDLDYLGIFNKIAPSYLYLKQASGTLSDYLAKIGIPSIVIRTMSSNEESMENCMAALNEFNNSTSIVLDVNDEIEMLETSNSGAHEIFRTADELFKSDISMAILGSDLGKDQSWAGSVKEGANTANMFVLDDIKFIEKWFKKLMEKLVALGLTEFEGVQLCISREKESDKQELLKNVIEFVKAGAQIDPEFIEETFGIPILGFNNLSTDEQSR